MLCGRWLGLWLVLTEHSIQPLHCKNCFAFGLLETTPDDSLTLLLKKLHVCHAFANPFPPLSSQRRYGFSYKGAWPKAACHVSDAHYLGLFLRAGKPEEIAVSTQLPLHAATPWAVSRAAWVRMNLTHRYRMGQFVFVALKCIGSSIFSKRSVFCFYRW